MATDLLLIRHAEAQAARARSDQVALTEDEGLTGEGVRQAERLGAWLARGPPPDALVSSPAVRALRTAEPVALETGLDIERVRDLEELRMDFPVGIGGDAAARAWDRARAQVDAPAFPTGETFRDFQGRVVAALRALLDRPAGQRVVAVCHGGVIEVFLLDALGIPLERAPEVHAHADHTGIFHWRDSGAPGAPLELVRANAVPHLVEPG